MNTFNIFRETDEADVLVRSCGDELAAIKLAFELCKKAENVGYGCFFHITRMHTYTSDEEYGVARDYAPLRLWNVFLDEKSNTVTMVKA